MTAAVTTATGHPTGYRLVWLAEVEPVCEILELSADPAVGLLVEQLRAARDHQEARCCAVPRSAFRFWPEDDAQARLLGEVLGDQRS